MWPGNSWHNWKSPDCSTSCLLSCSVRHVSLGFYVLVNFFLRQLVKWVQSLGSEAESVNFSSSWMSLENVLNKEIPLSFTVRACVQSSCALLVAGMLLLIQRQFTVCGLLLLQCGQPIHYLPLYSSLRQPWGPPRSHPLSKGICYFPCLAVHANKQLTDTVFKVRLH